MWKVKFGNEKKYVGITKMNFCCFINQMKHGRSQDLVLGGVLV